MAHDLPASTSLPPSAQARPPLARLGGPFVAGYRATRDLAKLFIDTFVAIIRGRAAWKLSLIHISEPTRPY